jgi:hypothetical protein
MTTSRKDRLLLCSAVALGLGISSGHPLGMIAAAGMPLVCLAPCTRNAAFGSAFAYYAAALWPMIPGLEAYWKSELLIPVLLWIFGAVLLSLPWAIAWTANRIHCLWRAPLALLATIIPPLGIVGLASPVTGAGYLFPGASWIGLAFVALLPGVVLSTQILQMRRRSVVLFSTSVICVALSMAGARLHERDVQVPRGWIAVDTHFGDVSRPFQDFTAAQFIQQTAAETSARVLIFPESVVPRWSEATEAFWRKSLDQCRARGQTLAIGAGVPARNGTQHDAVEKLNDLKSYDFVAAIDALQNNEVHRQWISNHQIIPLARPIDNTMLLVGSESATFYQRVPVPIGMWRPFSTATVPLRLGAPGVLPIDHERAAVLICYEQMLTYPILASILQHPTVIVGIGNTFWVKHTPIPLYQANALRAWAKLFHLPYISAANS